MHTIQSVQQQITYLDVYHRHYDLFVMIQPQMQHAVNALITPNVTKNTHIIAFLTTGESIAIIAVVLVLLFV